MVRCAIWYHLYNLKNVKNTHGRVLTLVKLHAEAFGCKPPVNLQTDKGTNVHRTRKFTSLVTAVLESPKLLTIYNLASRKLKVMMALVSLKVSSSMNLILGISEQIKWKVKVLIDNIFILAFLHILQNLFIFWTYLFVRGILSIREV